MTLSTCLLLLLLFSASPLPAVTFGEPRPVSPAVLEPAISTGKPAIAVGPGGEFLVVSARGTSLARLDADGDAIDRPAILLGQRPRFSPFHRSAEVVGTRNEWVLPLMEETHGGIELHLERFTGDGAPQRIGTVALPAALQVHLARSGSRWGVAFPRRSGAGSGVVTFDDAFRVGDPLFVHGRVIDLAADSERFAVLFDERLVLVGREGAIEDERRFPPGFQARALAPLAGGFAVAGTRLDLIDVLLIPPGGSALERIATFPAGDPGYTHVAIAAAAGQALVVWQATDDPVGPSGAEVRVARVSPDGSADRPVKVSEVVAAAHSVEDTGVAVAADDEGWLVVWREAAVPSPAYGRLVTVRVGRAETLAQLADDVDPAEWGATTQSAQGIARSGEVALAVWGEWRGSPLQFEILGARFDAGGRRLDEEEITLPFLGQPSVAGTADGFLYVGYWDGAILAYEIDRDGSVAPEPLEITRHPGYRAIRCAGEMCLAVWTDPPEPARPIVVRVARIAGGRVLDPGGIPIGSSAVLPIKLFEVATDGERFLVTWTRELPSILAASIVDPSGALDYRTFDVAVMAPSRSIVGGRAAWTGTRWEIVFSDFEGLRAVRIRPDGSVIDGAENGWEGTRVLEHYGVTSGPVDLFAVCGEVLAMMPGSLLEIGERSSRVLPAPPQRWAGAACFDARRCLALGDHIPRDWAAVPPNRAKVVPVDCGRKRTVARPGM